MKFKAFRTLRAPKGWQVIKVSTEEKPTRKVRKKAKERKE